MEPNTIAEIVALLQKVAKKVDSFEARFVGIDNQLESIREGIVHNAVAFDRLQSVVYNLRADVKELSEEVRHKRKSLV